MNQSNIQLLPIKQMRNTLIDAETDQNAEEDTSAKEEKQEEAPPTNEENTQNASNDPAKEKDTPVQAEDEHGHPSTDTSEETGNV